MRQIIIQSIIILLCFHVNVLGSDKRIAADLLSLERQYFNAQSDADRTAISFVKLQVFMKNQLSLRDECLQEIARINPDLLAPEAQQTFYWNAALVMLYNSNFTGSADMLSAYQSRSMDTSIEVQLTEILVRSYSPYDTLEARKLNGNMAQILECIQKEKAFAEKGTTRYNWCSYLIPGSGMMLKGYVTRGATALSLNVLSAVLVYSLARKGLFINATGYTLLALSKFYQGNIALTKSMLQRRVLKYRQQQMNTCHQELERLLVAHPLKFR